MSDTKRIEVTCWRVEIHKKEAAIGEMHYFETEGQAQLAIAWAAETRRQAIEARPDSDEIELTRRDYEDGGTQLKLTWMSQGVTYPCRQTDYFYVTRETLGRTVITEAP